MQSVKGRPCSVPRVAGLASGLIRMEVCSPFCHSSSIGGLLDLTSVSHLCQTTSVATVNDRGKFMLLNFLSFEAVQYTRWL